MTLKTNLLFYIYFLKEKHSEKIKRLRTEMVKEEVKRLEIFFYCKFDRQESLTLK